LLLAASEAIGAQSRQTFPQPSLHDPISISAQHAYRWQQGAYDLWLLEGDCRISQGVTHGRSARAVLWIEHGQPYGNHPHKIIAYLEDGVQLDFRQMPQAGGGMPRIARVQDESWFGRFYSLAPLRIDVPDVRAEPARKPPVFERGMARLDPTGNHAVRPVQFTEFGPGPGLTDAPPPGTRRIRGFPRNEGIGIQAEWFPSADGRESVGVLSQGIVLFIDGLADGRTIDIAADRIVVWTSGQPLDLTGQSLQQDDQPLEIYMEGNLVFREGDRVINATRMYYDARLRRGLILDAELLTPVPDFEGLARIKAAVMRQLEPDRFAAQDALVTTSRLGEPRYFFSSQLINVTDIQQPAINPLTGEPEIDPETGQPVIVHQRLAEGQNNFLHVGGVPILYWPTIATDLEDPTFYIDSLTVKSDSIFGNQVQLGLNGYEVLGIRNRPLGTKLNFDVDFFSDRGLGGGARFNYNRSDFFGFGGPTTGFVTGWVIEDEGLDNLGGDRRALQPEQDFRGRVLWNHRQALPIDFLLTAEFGWISDRNFLEQYFETDWNQRKDYTTGVQLKRLFDNQSLSLLADARVNAFFTQTEWLPRLDHYLLGESLLGDRLTWHQHTSVGYAQLKTTNIDPATPSAAKFPLAWETDAGGILQPVFAGERIVTRHEIDYPLEAGPVKVVPYALGEFGHWGEDRFGGDVQRAYFQTGARASIPFWSVDPTVENNLLNVHGLAHKIVVNGEFSYADANRDLDRFPLFDPLDDDSIEHFRRRFFFNTFGGVGDPGMPDDVPLRFDERFYALRSGLAGNVTSPVPEIADDLTAVRLGVRQRWQTKRGRPGERRIIDWIVLDANATWFPEEDRDNFGEPLGLVDYDFRWHVGDRFTLLSTGAFDFFADAQREITVGGFLDRRPQGNLFLGLRSKEGLFSSNVVLARFNYQLSVKWFTSFSTSVDLGDAGNIGQTFSLTRVGESLLVRAGVTVNDSKDVVRATIIVEPRFLPRSQRGSLVGMRVPPAGAFGLE